MACALALSALQPAPAWAQAAVRAAAPASLPQSPEELILNVLANGVARGEARLARLPDGDFWVAADDLPKLRVEPQEGALRELGGERFYSLRALGASSLAFNEAELTLSLQFPSASIPGTRIDLLGRPPPAPLVRPGNSLIASYRLSMRPPLQGQQGQTVLEQDLNLRLGPLLLRQELRLDTANLERRLSRGPTQAVWDRPASASRVVAGDLFSTAGPYGSAITGAGLMLSKVFEITPDVLKQPTATLRATAAMPADVEVAVDGTVLYRERVGPGPITLNNLLLYGGTRNVRVTVTDVTGRREVVEQPVFFTDAVLAEGLHDYSYFIGRRSDIGAGGQPIYREAAWQAFHRYGVSDYLTVGAGGEGSPDFTNLGAGATLRSDRLGLFSLDLLSSHDRERGRRVPGWSARYSYVLPELSLFLSRRRYGEGFRSFTTTADVPFLRNETLVGVATRLWQTSLSFDVTRREDALERRTSAALRLSGQLARGVTLGAELQRGRINGLPDWSASLYLRAQLGGPYWAASSARVEPGLRGFDIEAGKQIGQGEGLGWRVGTHATQQQDAASTFAFASATWNLKPASLEFFGSSQLQGGNAQYAELAVSGSLVGVAGEWGLMRRVSDSFVLARLGVPVPGVEVSLNNQVQGTTDASGNLLVPGVGAYGRQDLSINDKQVSLQYNLRERRRTLSLPYRSGVVVDFGGQRVRALAGIAWRQLAGKREPIAARAWTLTGPAGSLAIETSRNGDFYLENAPPGRYQGSIEVDGKQYSCAMDVPDSPEAVQELREGLICE